MLSYDCECDDIPLAQEEAKMVSLSGFCCHLG